MRPHGLLLCALVFVIGCGDDDAAPVPAGRHGDPAGAIAECRAGLGAMAETPPSERAVRLAAACADLYVEPRCRDAMRSLASVPLETRAVSIARACSDAYCPLLTAPKPSLCAGMPDAPARLASQWRELQHAIFRHDLGAEHAADLASALAEAHVPVTLEVPPAPTAPTGTLHVAVRADADTLHLFVTPPGATPTEHTVPHPATAESLAAVLPPAPAENARAVIAADREVSYATVVTLMDALRTAGFSELSLQAAPVE